MFIIVLFISHLLEVSAKLQGDRGNLKYHIPNSKDIFQITTSGINFTNLTKTWTNVLIYKRVGNNLISDNGDH